MFLVILGYYEVLNTDGVSSDAYTLPTLKTVKRKI